MTYSFIYSSKVKAIKTTEKSSIDRIDIIANFCEISFGDSDEGRS